MNLIVSAVFLYFCIVMKIAIIEDELLAVNYLKNLLDTQSIVPVTETVILRSKNRQLSSLRKIRLILFLWIFILEME